MISESRPYGYYSLLHTPRDANKQYLALAYIARYESIKYEHGDGTLEELEKLSLFWEMMPQENLMTFS